MTASALFTFGENLMRKLLPLAILMALPVAAAATSPACTISFAGAQQDVCTGQVQMATTGADNLLSLAPKKDSSLRVVKFDGPITAAERRAVEAAGARIINYVPHYAYLVRMPAKLDEAMRRIDGVAWVGPMMPALKIDPNIYSQLKHGNLVEGLGILDLVITFDVGDHVGKSQMQMRMAKVAGLSHIRVMDVAGEMQAHAYFDVGTLATTVEQLARRDDVLSVSFRKPVNLYNSQGHWLHQSNVNSPAPEAPVWDHGIYGCNQIVGELDSGLWLGHVAFADPVEATPVEVCSSGTSCGVMANPNPNARKVIGYYKWSGLSGNSWTDDSLGHGTHVAGSIAGNVTGHLTNPPAGFPCMNGTTPDVNSDLDGMAPGAKMVMQEAGGSLQYLNDFGGNIYHAADIAYQTGARIHSDSWGGSCVNLFGLCVSDCTVTYNAGSRNADRIMNEHDDLLVVVAAGNDGTVCSAGNNVGSPGNAKSIISVGASGRGTSGNAMAGFSSRGPALDGRTKPDLTAQGAGIMSAKSHSTDGVKSMSGTSMATPTTSGLAALVRDYLAQGFYPSGLKTPSDAITSPSGALIKAIMLAGATEMTGSGAGANPGQDQGFGRILLDDSLYFDGDASKLFFADETTGLATGGMNQYTLDAQAGERLTIVLAWTDAPAAVNASPALVNDLRLEVQAPNGDMWSQKLPASFSVNNADPFQDSTTANYDDINNVERVRFDAPQAGTYIITVSGINVPSGAQTYALAATGNFQITQDPGFSLSTSTTTQSICAGNPASYDIGVRSRFGFTDPVTLATVGLPAGTSESFSVNPVTPATPAASSQLTVANTASLATGSYSFDVSGTASAALPPTRTLSFGLDVVAGIPAAPVLSAPASGATSVVLSPTFSWAADPAVDSYVVEVASDSAFTNIFASGTTSNDSWTLAAPLDPETTYYWRVRPANACGTGSDSAVWSFTTGQPAFPLPYCSIDFTSKVEPITRVKISGIDNSSSATVGGSTPKMENFLSVPGGDVQSGSSYDLRVEGNTSGNWDTSIKAYIDWDRSATFDSGEGYEIGILSNSTGTDGKNVTTAIPVPTSVTGGPVRMRVVKMWTYGNTYPLACGTESYGQSEDYTLHVLTDLIFADGFEVE